MASTFEPIYAQQVDAELLSGLEHKKYLARALRARQCAPLHVG